MEFKEWLSKQYLLAGATAAAMLGTALSSPVPLKKSRPTCSGGPVQKDVFIPAHLGRMSKEELALQRRLAAERRTKANSNEVK